MSRLMENRDKREQSTFVSPYILLLRVHPRDEATKIINQNGHVHERQVVQNAFRGRNGLVE